MTKNNSFFLLGLASLLFSACSLSPQTPPSEVPPSASEPEAVSGSQGLSLREILDLGQAQKCTWQITQEGNNINGETKVKGNKFAQTMVIQTPQGDITTHAVSDGEWYYTWTDGGPAGSPAGVGNMTFKVKIDPTQSTPPTTDYTQGLVDWNQKMDLNCQPATISDSELEVPPSILKSATDLADFQKQFEKLLPSVPASN